MVSELLIEGEGAALRSDADALLFTLRAGAPPLRLRGLELIGRIVVDGGEMELSNCTVKPRTVLHHTSCYERSAAFI